MIQTIYPYGSVNINQILYVKQKGEKYYFYDKCGRWLISKETYQELLDRGIPSEESEKCLRNY